MQKTYSYGRQLIEEDDVQAVVEALRSDWLTQGPAIPAFENALAGILGSPYAAAVANGTAALHLIALTLGWKRGDLVLTVPITFLASANCILYAGATPDFVDIDPNSFTICPNRLEEKVRALTAKHQPIKAVVAVDYAGHPCDWAALRSLADRYGFQLVADACHSLGARYRSERSYAAKYADLTALSFHPVKHITTGEGGAVLTRRTEWDERIRILRSHGMTKDEELLEKNDGPWYYEMHDLGFNYRITDLQCALGLSQLKKLDRFIQRRQEIATTYQRLLGADERLTLPQASPEVSHAYHLYPLQVHFEQMALSKKDFVGRLKEKNILCQVHYIPVHLQPYYRKRFGFAAGDFPISERFYQREISIPMHPLLNDEDVAYVAKQIKETLS